MIVLKAELKSTGSSHMSLVCLGIDCHMIVKCFGCTAIHNKALYKCIIYSFIGVAEHNAVPC